VAAWLWGFSVRRRDKLADDYLLLREGIAVLANTESDTKLDEAGRGLGRGLDFGLGTE
jgi:hypothetical protein